MLFVSFCAVMYKKYVLNMNEEKNLLQEFPHSAENKLFSFALHLFCISDAISECVLVVLQIF